MSFAEKRREEQSREKFEKNSPRNLVKHANRPRFDVLIDTLKRNGLSAAEKGMYAIEATRLAYPEECPETEKLTESEAKRLVRNARSIVYFCVNKDASENKRDKMNEKFIDIQDEIGGNTTTTSVAAFIGAAIN